MSQLQINITVFALAIATIAVLYVILMLCQHEHTVWKSGLLSCMVLLGVAVILIFVPYYSRYSGLAGMLGVFIMICSVCYVRYKKAEGWELDRITRSDYVIRAGIGLVLAGFVGAPFFTVFNSQEQVKQSQSGIIGLLFRIEKRVEVLITMLERDHEERQAFREEFKQDIKGVSGGVQQSLQNDKQVKKALTRANRASRTKQSPPLIIVAPAPRQLPQASFELPTIKQPATTTPTRIRGRKVGLVDQVYDLDEVAQYRDN